MLFDNNNRLLLLNTSLAADIIILAIGTGAEIQSRDGRITAINAVRE